MNDDINIIHNFSHHSVDSLVMKLKCSIFILCYLALLGEIWAAESMGPVGKITLNSIYECSGEEKPKGDDMKLKIELKNSGDDKAIDAQLETKIVFDDSLNFVMDLQKKDNGVWKNFYNLKGKACRDFHRYFKKIWDKMINGAEPKIDKPCPIPAGNYKLTNFKATSQDIETKTIFYGNLLAKTIITDKTGKIVLCLMGEGESQP